MLATIFRIFGGLALVLSGFMAMSSFKTGSGGLMLALAPLAVAVVMFGIAEILGAVTRTADASERTAAAVEEMARRVR